MPSTRHEKKETRKINKALNVICQLLNVSRARAPEQWVMVWGAGLGLGIPKMVLFNFLAPGPVEIRYYAKQPFCVARFESSSQATVCKNSRNGLSLPGMLPIYIDYMLQEPPPEDPSILRSFHSEWPGGLTLLEEFITAADEKHFLRELFPTEENEDIEPLKSNESMTTLPVSRLLPPAQTKLKNRLVQHFGYEFRYKTNDVDLETPNAPPIPRYLTKTIHKMMEYNVVQRIPEQLTMNCYLPGQGIPPHVDTHSVFEQPILSLSLGSPVVIDFRHGRQHLSLILPPRSLLIMREEARYLWTHGIGARRYDIQNDASDYKFGVDVVHRGVRVSLTFRLLNESRVCRCKFPQMCDSQKGHLFNSDMAPRIERDLVHKVYDEIASHFSQTRHTPWPRVKEFLGQVAQGQSVLDVGCGNGKYFKLTDYIYEVGMDMSQALLQIARNDKCVDGVRANCLQLPFKSGCFDAVISIAVLHHLATPERRLEALTEIYRVLSPGGRALIYVWAQDQKLKEVKSSYAHQIALKLDREPIPYAENSEVICPPKDYSFLPVHLHQENFLFNDMLVPWMKETSVYHRFYHVFTRGELDSLIGQIDAVPPPRIIDSYYDQGNWCCVIHKDDHLNASNLPPYPRIPIATLTNPDSLPTVSIAPSHT